MTLSQCSKNAETAWTSWDDKLDSDVLTKIVDEQQKLAQGITTPDEFIETCDSFVKIKNFKHAVMRLADYSSVSFKERRGGNLMQKAFGKKSVIFMFLFPAFLIYTAFVIVSIIWAGYYSFFDWGGVGEKVFVGFKNL